jgi:hypothetical protein
MCCQFVLCPNLDLQQQSAENDLSRMNAQYREGVLALNPIHLSDNNHEILMDAASLREGLDYKEEIPDSTLKPATALKTWRRKTTPTMKAVTRTMKIDW